MPTMLESILSYLCSERKVFITANIAPIPFPLTPVHSLPKVPPTILSPKFRVCFSYQIKKIEVQFSCSVVSNSLQPHEPQHTRPPCPPPTVGVYPNLCPLSQWCHPTISSSIIPFSSCPQSFPASGSFWMSQLFSSGGQSIGVSASGSVLPVNTQDWSACFSY